MRKYFKNKKEIYKALVNGHTINNQFNSTAEGVYLNNEGELIDKTQGKIIDLKFIDCCQWYKVTKAHYCYKSLNSNDYQVSIFSYESDEDFSESIGPMLFFVRLQEEVE